MYPLKSMILYYNNNNSNNNNIYIRLDVFVKIYH